MAFENFGLGQEGPSTPDLQRLVEGVVEATVARIASGALKPFLTSKECARLIGVTPEYLCAMRARGEGPPWSGAGKWTRYERRAVLIWLADLPRDNRLLANDLNDPVSSEAQPQTTPSARQIHLRTPANKRKDEQP